MREEKKVAEKKFVPEMFDIISYNCLLEIEIYSIQIHTFIKEESILAFEIQI